MSPAVDPVIQGSRFRSVNVPLNPIIFDSGNVTSRRLPLGNLIKGYILRLSGSISWSSGTPTIVAGEQPLDLIQKIEIIADGNRTLWTSSGRDAFRMAHFLYGKQNELVPPNFALASPVSFSATIRLDSAAIRAIKPVESYFNTRRYQNVELRVTWGTLANIATGGTGTAIATNTQVDVIVQMTTTGFGLQRFDKLTMFDEFPVTATSTNLTQDIPRNGLLARILIHAFRDGAVDDTLINKVTIAGDYTFRMRDTLNWRTLQQGNVADYQLDGAAVVGNQIPGYALIDFVEDGLLSSAINTYDLTKLQAVFDVTLGSGTTRLIRMTYEFYEPLPEAIEG